MIKVINSKDELDLLKMVYIGEGREGISYRNNDIVIKIYKEYPKRLLFMGEESLYLTFPIDIYNDCNGNILAHTMKYVNGIKIDSGFPKHIKIDKLIEAYEVFIEEISRYPNIYMRDLCLDNILYNELNNRFYLIDTTLWENLDDSLGLNIARLNQNLAHALYQTISWIEEYDFWNNNVEFKRNFYGSKNVEFINFITFLNQTIEVISKYYSKKIVTVEDLSSEMKKKT